MKAYAFVYLNMLSDYRVFPKSSNVSFFFFFFFFFAGGGGGRGPSIFPPIDFVFKRSTKVSNYLIYRSDYIILNIRYTHIHIDSVNVRL